MSAPMLEQLRCLIRMLLTCHFSKKLATHKPQQRTNVHLHLFFTQVNTYVYMYVVCTYV